MRRRRLNALKVQHVFLRRNVTRTQTWNRVLGVTVKDKEALPHRGSEEKPPLKQTRKLSVRVERAIGGIRFVIRAALPQTFQFVVPNAAAHKILASVHDDAELFGN